MNVQIHELRQVAVSETTKHNRTVKFHSLPKQFPDDPVTLECVIQYTKDEAEAQNPGPSLAAKAGMLDSTVIPAVHQAFADMATLRNIELLSEDEMSKRGAAFAASLGLKKKRNGRYGSAGNDKTDLGLFRTMHRFVFDGE